MQGRLLFLTAILIGFYSYSIFFLGIFSLINGISIFFVSLTIFIIVFYSVLHHPDSVKSLYVQAKKNFFYFFIFLILAVINIIGALGPELGFDALWYHLVIPKLYIESGVIEFIPGGLLYYSVMPKLIDLLYVPALMFSNETAAKLIHFMFGVLCSIVTYKIANLFVSKKLSYLAAIIFYSNLVVGWMSITAYIDLGRAFYASLSIYFFILYLKLRNIKYLLFSAILVGLEMSTKLLGISTLLSFIFVILFINNQNNTLKIRSAFLLGFIPFLIVLPWLIFSWVNTGNIVYPFFTNIYPSGFSFGSFNPLTILKDTVSLFLLSADPISPIYIIVLPLIVVFFRKMPKELKVLSMILLINILIWNFIPQKNSRFILPYLPIFSVLVVWVISKSNKSIKTILYIFTYLIILVNIFYRGAANAKYMPVILGFQSKEEFLVENLNFEFGDYVDRENRVKNIVGNNKVLVYGIHNLFYVDFPYEHESWSNNKEYKYVLTKNDSNMEKGYNLIYKDLVTSTYLYEKN